eukprot:TRINITY_DN752_c0_g1_i5.p1 TRINITY_DN752_c0_g1~~TRINITY_DN752_c0_g1_i5.p1  ORF type:complete len:114 (+),score=17.13 TRINITY_DN752_c0_g1_i5:177-518(+)
MCIRDRFLVNSRHPLLCATPHWLPNARSPFSRSYGGILPSSFNVVLSSALVCSTCPPVSVWGTVYMMGLFPGTPRPHTQSNKNVRLPVFGTSCLLYTSPSPRDRTRSRMPSSA